MSNYFVFTDEAGTYQRHPSDAHIRSHPFYIRSNVVMAIDDYRQYQIDMQRIAGEYEISFDEEIKWSDLWGKTKGNPRNDLISTMPLNRLKPYFRYLDNKNMIKSSLRQSRIFMWYWLSKAGNDKGMTIKVTPNSFIAVIHLGEASPSVTAKACDHPR